MTLFFKYYLGITLKYIKPEFRDEVMDYYILVYSNCKYESLRDLHLVANILTILEYKDGFIIQEKLNLFFLNLTKEDADKISFRLECDLEKYAINGDLISKCFFNDILDEKKENTEKELLTLEKKLLNKK